MWNNNTPSLCCLFEFSTHNNQYLPSWQECTVSRSPNLLSLLERVNIVLNAPPCNSVGSADTEDCKHKQKKKSVCNVNIPHKKKLDSWKIHCVLTNIYTLSCTSQSPADGCLYSHFKFKLCSKQLLPFRGE